MREDVLAAVRVRLRRLDEGGDLSLALEPGAAREIRQLALLIHADLDDVEMLLVMGRLRWYRSRALPVDEGGRRELQAAVTAFTRPLKAGRTEGVPPELLPRIAHDVAPGADTVLDTAVNSPDAERAAEAVILWQRILDATPTDHADRLMYQSNLSVALMTRYERQGTAEDLDAALEGCRAVLSATPPGDHALPGRISNYGVALLARWEAKGDLGDLDKAVELLRRAVSRSPEGVGVRGDRLVNLGSALRSRSGLLGTASDLDAAVACLQEAAEILRGYAPERSAALSALGAALGERYERIGRADDLDSSVVALQQAVRVASPGTAGLAGYLNNLAVALRNRFSRHGQRIDLDEAVDAGRRAVNLTPSGSSDRARHLAGLARSLSLRAGHTGAPEDLDVTIRLLRQAVRETPTGHPARALHLTDLGTALHERFFAVLRDRSNMTRSVRTGDLRAAVRAWTQASRVDTAPARNRIEAAWTAARALRRTDPGSAADMAEAAVGLLPRLTPRRLERGDQQHVLSAFPGLASEAAALALADPEGTPERRAARALRLLEAGRAVALGQALDARNDLTDLRRRHAAVAGRFTELRDGLDQPLESAGSGFSEAGTRSARLTPDGVAAERQRLADEFTAVLEEIRGLPGFSSFGLPPALDDLLAEAEAEAGAGAVVVVNVSRHRSDALLLTGGQVRSVPLPDLTAREVASRSESFRQALIRTETLGDPAQRRRAQGVLTEILEWLWDAAAAPILDALGHRERPSAGAEWPRVWWVPSGLLAQLPLHAAGHHTDAEDSRRRTVLDRAVSSYTPTVRVLRHAREQVRRRAGGTRAADGQYRALIIAMPTTPGHADLDHVADEVAVVRAHLPGATILAGPDPGAGPSAPPSPPFTVPTRERVLTRLPDCAIAHFACHGESHLTDPSRSRLLLHDHTDAPFTVAGLAAVHLDRAELAYLSACRTTVVEPGFLADEPIHLTVALQTAGFPHVIGTLWEIDDATAVTVAGAFYTGLRTGSGKLDTTRAAHALHTAVRATRDRFAVTPSLWAGYVHAGA
ncbi:CHAT domain-containing protein [Streptomyces niveus]